MSEMESGENVNDTWDTHDMVIQMRREKGKIKDQKKRGEASRLKVDRFE